MKLSTQRLDGAKLTRGVWWNYETQSTCPGNVPEEGRFCLRILPSIAGRLVIALAEEQRKDLDLLRENPPAADASVVERDEYRVRHAAFARKTLAAAIVRTTLLEWQGLEDDDGKAIPFTPDKALSILSDAAYLELLQFVEQAAMTNGAAREEAEAAGN